jgi:hypothetical protein
VRQSRRNWLAFYDHNGQALDLLRREPIAAAHHAAAFDLFLIRKVA